MSRRYISSQKARHLRRLAKMISASEVRMPAPRFPQQETGSIGGRDRTRFPFLQHLTFNGIPLIFDPSLEWKDTDQLAECAAMMHALNSVPNHLIHRNHP